MNLNLKAALPIMAIVAIAIIAALLLLPNLGLSGLFAQQQTSDLIKVRAGNLPVVQGLPMYLAIDKGYFKEAGIDLQLTSFDAPNQLVDALLQNRIDFIPTTGGAGVAAVANYKNPGKIKIFALAGGTKDNTAEDLLVPIDSNISSITELKGKKMGILGGSIQWRILATDILARNGLIADKDVVLVELAPGLQVQALASKQIDALLAIDPMRITILDTNIGKELMQGPIENTISDPFYPGAGVLNVEFATKNPETTQKVISVLKKAIDEINQNPEAARQYLKGHTPLTYALIPKIAMPVFKICGDITQNDVSSLQSFYDLFPKYNVVEGKIDAKSILYCQAA